MASHFASCQANISSSSKEKKFFIAQSRQEKSHAFFFKKAADYISPRETYYVPVTLKKFEHRLATALDKHQYCDLVIGTQIVLEGFGEQVLTRLNKVMDQQKIGFKSQRKLILKHRKKSHFAFGLHALKKMIDNNSISLEQAQETSSEYILMLSAIVSEMEEVIVDLNTTTDSYFDTLSCQLPNWLMPDSQTP